jgi:hypothetical protein
LPIKEFFKNTSTGFLRFDGIFLVAYALLAHIHIGAIPFWWSGTATRCGFGSDKLKILLHYVPKIHQCCEGEPVVFGSITQYIRGKNVRVYPIYSELIPNNEYNV